MNLSLLPTLRTQRELHAIPRGMERFRAYLSAMTDGTDDIALPITSMNPMRVVVAPAAISCEASTSIPAVAIAVATT